MHRTGVILAGLALLGLSGCSGNGTVTLHRTFTDLVYDFTAGQSCREQEAQAGSDYYVTVAVDNVPAASVPVIWHDNAYTTQGTRACAGTWTATVGSARVAYQISMTGNDGFGFHGTDDVSPASAGQVIALTNAPAG